MTAPPTYPRSSSATRPCPGLLGSLVCRRWLATIEAASTSRSMPYPIVYNSSPSPCLLFSTTSIRILEHHAMLNPHVLGLSLFRRLPATTVLPPRSDS